MEKITYYHKNSDVITYEKIINEDGYWEERTYDEKGNQLTYKDSYNYWEERTYDEKGNTVFFINSEGYWNKRTYDENGNELTFKDSYDDYRIRGRKVIKEEFEAFVNSLENPLLSKIAELEK